MRNSLTRFVFAVLLSTAVGMTFAGTPPKFNIPEGASQESVDSKSTVCSRPFDRNMACRKDADLILQCVNESEVTIVIPTVNVKLFGKPYSVGGGGKLHIPVKIVPASELGDGHAAEYHSDTGAIYISENDYCKYQEERQKGSKRDKEWTDKFGNILRHEGIHYLVDKEYLKDFLDENGNRDGEVDDYYHFMSEMLAYVGGDGMSEKDAAKAILSACVIESKWYVFEKCSSKVYLKGVRDIAQKFLNGEPYMPPEVRSNKGHGDSPMPVSVADKIPDLSKLIDLVKQSVEYLRRMNSMSHKPSEEDYAGYNKLGAMARAEIKAIENEIAQMNLTEKEKGELGNELGKQIRERVMPYCDTIASLRKQIEAKGYGRFEDSNFNFDPKYLK